jgi:hypothetical protein
MLQPALTTLHDDLLKTTRPAADQRGIMQIRPVLDRPHLFIRVVRVLRGHICIECPVPPP